MGELLLNWLNDQIQLSRKITNFEQDFHNGFLFGQLLAKYSQQLNFHEFVDKDDKASRINNFSLLMDTFTALRVTFDSNIAMKIINKELGVSKKLLYELKTQLQKTNDNAFSKTNRLNKTLTPLKKIQISKQRFDQVAKQHFVKQLNELHPAQKEIIEQNLLKKFVDFEHKSRLKAAQEEEKARQAKLLLQSKFNEQERENIKKSQQFRKQWEADHLQKWAANRTIRQTQVAKDEQYRSKLQNQKIQSRTMSQMNAMKALGNDIANFQRKNLANRIPDDSDSEHETQPKLNKTSTERPEQLKVKEEVKDQRRLTAAENEKKKHQREKRRRKMIVEQQKRYKMVQITRRERCIIATIEQTSKQEKEIQYEIWRAWQNKNVILENKALFDDKIREKSQTREINAKFKKEELLKVYREEHRAEVAAGVAETTVLQRRHQVSARKRDYKECQKMIEELLELTENLYDSCQQRNTQQIDNAQLQTSLIRFVEGTKSIEEENALKLKHYVQGENQWKLSIVRPEEEVSTDPKDDNSLPNDYVNNYYLGNVLRNIFEQQIGTPSKAIYSSPPNKILISVIGLDFARKHYVTEKIASQNGFKVIEVDKLIEQKLKDWQEFKKKSLQVSQETDALATQSFSGSTIDEKLVIKLIKEQTDKYPSSILLDYPNTYQQAIELCRVISNVSPHDMVAQDRLTRKIKEFQRLVKSSEAKVISRQVRECGVDFVWWIELSPEKALDRMLGRRWIGTSEVHINNEIEPYNLRQGEKGSAIVMRNHFELKNKANLYDWFSMFGTEFGQSQLVSQRCWQQIDGSSDKQELESVVLAKLKEVLELKQKQKEWAKLKEEQEKKAQLTREEEAKNRQSIRQKCSFTSQDNIKIELSAALGKSQLDKAFIEQMTELWNRIESTTVNGLIKAFQNLQQQQLGKRSHIAQIKKSFIALLTREDHKFYLIKDFQIKYNQFITENEDMLAYEYTKQELHQRVEDLENDLLTVVEEKKEDAVADRSAVIGSGWLQSQLNIISSCLYLLVQTELNRFAVSEKLLVDYYAKRFMVNTKAFEALSPQLNNDVISPLDNFKDGNCPKLEKIVSEALRILNREEEVLDDKAKKGGKAPPKKEEKKAAKKGGKDEVEEVKEPTAEELELKKAVNTQKAILRQRLNRIKTFGSSKLKDTYNSMQKLYAQLQDLYVYTYKVECQAIRNLTKIFKKAIEKEQKIQSEVQIHHVEVTQTQKIRNFQKEQPIILPAREQPSSSQFTITNINEVFKLFREQAQGHLISTKRLTILMKRLVTNPQLRKLLPMSWQGLTAAQAQKFAQLLDHQSAAYVSLVKILMFIVLSGYSIPNEEQLQQYTLDLTNYSSLKQLSADRFIATPAWFDEPLQQKQNVRPFRRNEFVKRELFELFKRADGLLQIDSYLQAISLSEFSRVKRVDVGERTYFDFAFV